MRRLFTGIVVANALLFASSAATLGLGLADPDEKESVAAGPSDGGTAEPDLPTKGLAAADKAAGVTVLDAGAEPRRRLRFRPVAGTVTRLALTTKLDLDITVDGESAPTAPAPTMRVVLEQRVDAVDEDGLADFTYFFAEVTATGGDLPPDARQQFESLLDQLATVRGTGTIDPYGTTSDSNIDTTGVTDPMASQLLDSLSQQLDNLSPRLPRQAVGIGARWSVDDTLRLVGLTNDLVTTFELRSLEGDDIELGVEVEGVVRPGPVDIPGVPEVLDVTVVTFTSRSTGTIAADLTKVLPSRVDQRGTAEGELELSDGLDTATMEQRLRIKVTLAPA